MRPVDAIQRRGSGSSTLIIGLIAVVLLLAGVMFYFARQQISARSPAKTADHSAETRDSSPSPISGSAALLSEASVGVPLPVEPLATTPPSVSDSNALETIVAAPPPAPTIVTQVIVIATNPPAPLPPALKLQMVLFSPSRPSAMINGKTVFVGDRIADARVVAITQTTVSVLQDGQTNVLSLD
jgi:hypothetical protein